MKWTLRSPIHEAEAPEDRRMSSINCGLVKMRPCSLVLRWLTITFKLSFLARATTEILNDSGPCLQAERARAAAR